MRAEFNLTARFMRRHVRQQAASVLIITLFATAILLMLFMAQCFLAANEKTAYYYYGDFSGETMFADSAKVKAAQQSLQKEGAGVIATQAQIETSDSSYVVYLGYMDENARKMRAVRLKSGTFPNSPSEIALDETTYSRLQLTASAGDKVKLNVNENGKTVTHQYTLTGILYDYFDHWNMLTENALNYKNPELPAVLLGKEPDNPLAVHVMHSKFGQTENLGGNYIFNPEEGRMQEYTGALNRSSAGVTVAIGLFFLILSLFGISVLARVTLQDRERFINTLNCVGITRRERRNLLLIQAAILVAIAFIISIPLSLGALALSIYALKLLGITIMWSISFLPIIVTFVLIMLFTLIIFTVQQNKRFGHHNSRKDRKKQFVPSRSFSQAWTKLYRRSKFGKSTAITILNAASIFALVFGIFSAELAGATHSYGLVQALGKSDYYVYIAQGSLSISAFDANFPRDLGMSKEELDKLRTDKNISVKYAYISNLIMPAFFRVQPDETNERLNSLKKRYSFEDTVYADDEETKSQIKAARELFGYRENESLVAYPKIIAVDTETMETLLKQAKIKYERQLQDFEQGKTVYALGGIFNKGDHFTITMPVIPKGSTADRISGNTETADFNVSVADSFTRADEDTAGPGNFPYGSIKNPCVIISADSIMKADTQLRYSYIIADNANPDNVESCSKASEALHNAASVSKGMLISDKAKNINDWNQIVKQQKWPIYVLVFAFVIILIEAVALLSRIKLKTNLHTYALLRSVGMEESRLKRRLIFDTIRYTGLGIVIGLIFSFLFITVLTTHYWYVPMLPVIINVILPFAICETVLLLLLSAITTAMTVKSILNDNIIKSLQTVVF